MEIPTQQKAAVKGESHECEVKEVDVPQPGPGQLLCKINYSGLCGTDKSYLYDEYASMGMRMQETAKGISGHEGAGFVVKMGAGVDDSWKEGDRVGIKWVRSICGKCEFCTNGTDELQCPKQQNSGFTVPGTFQEYCLTDAAYATRIPLGVKDEEAGPIMCGGVTSYVACKRSQVKPGQWIVLPGAGGGLGHLAIQYAKAMGMRVIAVDGGAEKEKLCMSLGAEHFIDYTTVADLPAEVIRITTHGAHGVIVTAATKEGYATAPGLLRPRGTMVCVGIPKDPTILAGPPPALLIAKQLKIVGSFAGTLRDVDEALDFTARGLVRPVLTHGSLHDLNDLCAKMHTGKLAGRAVIKISA